MYTWTNCKESSWRTKRDEEQLVGHDPNSKMMCLICMLRKREKSRECLIGVALTTPPNENTHDDPIKAKP